MDEEITYSTFDSLRPHFDALARAGYFKIVLKPLSNLKRCLHDTYRYILCFLIVMYNVQHLIRVVLVRHSSDLMVDTLFILLTTLNALGKQAAFNFRSHRIDNIINTINGPYFAASRPYHVEALKSNAVLMSRLLTLYHIAVMSCGLMWTVFPLVNRALGDAVPFTGYFPFETMTTPAFELTLAYMSILIVFQAYGNVTMDCTIVAFYAQAQAQIRILRYNLEQLVEFDGGKINRILTKSANKISYKNDKKEKPELQQRLIKCVVHHQQILRFAKEVESIFGEAMVIQFFVMAWVICMTVYKIVGVCVFIFYIMAWFLYNGNQKRIKLSIISAEFVSMAMYLGCMLAQLFIYCYFGTQLQVESEFINQSIYCCNWLSLTPRLRRQLLVMMQFCARPIVSRIAYIIPMSLETYIAVLKSSYTLFAFLNR